VTEKVVKNSRSLKSLGGDPNGKKEKPRMKRILPKEKPSTDGRKSQKPIWVKKMADDGCIQTQIQGTRRCEGKGWG